MNRVVMWNTVTNSSRLKTCEIEHTISEAPFSNKRLQLREIYEKLTYGSKKYLNLTNLVFCNNDDAISSKTSALTHARNWVLCLHENIKQTLAKHTSRTEHRRVIQGMSAGVGN